MVSLIVSSQSPHNDFSIIIIIVVVDVLLLQLSFFFFTRCEFFPAALAGGLSLEFEWQQIYEGLQDSPEYSSWSEQCSGPYGLDSFYNF